MQVILASTSPRRKELLELLQIPFSVVEPTCDEEGAESLSARNVVQYLARQKAQSVAAHFPDALVLGGDTLIEINGKILGKPQNLHEAAVMLRQLNGQMHHVHSGIAIVCLKNNRILTEAETVQVHMKTLSETQIQVYLETKESLGKAGGYCIQEEGGKLIKKISGDFSAVVGFPLKKIAKLLEKEGLDLPVKIKEIYKKKPYAKWKDFA